ncbi:MAG: sulfur carrier protein ThiS [Acidimicrobiia bacterium]|nr:sulfur carrier protein ThiS [Acidimicrobiia bacterium]
MNVTVNAEPRTVPDGATVAHLVEEDAKGVAVAVNEEVVPRSQWPETSLHDGDRIEILEAHQGG